jgi:glycosyltransferase involved in cell wall biosynthesis
MKKFVLAVFFDHSITSGGNFQQSFNNIMLANKLSSEEIEVKIITNKKDNLKILKDFQLNPHFFKINFFSKILINIRESLPNLLYRFLTFFSKKNKFEKFLEKLDVDLIYFVSQSSYANYVHSINYIYTIFDLCHRDCPEFPEVRKNRIFEFREGESKKNLPRAIAVLTDSYLGKENVIYRYNLDSNRVHVFPFSPSLTIQLKAKSNEYEKLDENFIDVKKKYQLTFDYIFYPAQFWSHKNHIYILKALDILRTENSIQLGAIFAGDDRGNLSYIKEMTKKLNLDSQVRFVGFVSNEEIFYLYSQSLALVMPTYFGPTNMPPLEAFKLNVPVLYSDLPGLKDQVNDAALLLDLNNPYSLVSNLEKLMSSIDLRNTLIKKGKQRYEELISNNNSYYTLKKIIKEFKSRRDCWK